MNCFINFNPTSTAFNSVFKQVLGTSAYLGGSYAVLDGIYQGAIDGMIFYHKMHSWRVLVTPWDAIREEAQGIVTLFLQKVFLGAALCVAGAYFHSWAHVK